MSESIRKEILSGVKRVVIKLGSSVLTHGSGELSEGVFDDYAREISALKGRGIEPVLVSSGAIAAGMKKLKIKERPHEIVAKQAIAACGQSALIWYYEQAFSVFGERVAQILLTHDVLTARKRFLNARKTLFTLIGMGVIPIVNENDTVAVEEIMVGDNDNLSAMVTSLVEADLMVLLTDIGGLYTQDPRANDDARMISVVDEIDESVERFAGDTKGRTTTGGMRTKIEAAKTAAAFGVPTIIASGRSAAVIDDIFEGKDTGTLFLPATEKLKSRKHWIAYTLKLAGAIVIDGGAVKAIVSGGKSLLPSGIKSVCGRFGVGDLVRCVDTTGKEVARGLSSYGSEEIAKIAGKRTQDIEGVLGYKYSDEVIHRDDLVVMKK